MTIVVETPPEGGQTDGQNKEASYCHQDIDTDRIQFTYSKSGNTHYWKLDGSFSINCSCKEDSEESIGKCNTACKLNSSLGNLPRYFKGGYLSVVWDFSDPGEGAVLGCFIDNIDNKGNVDFKACSNGTQFVEDQIAKYLKDKSLSCLSTNNV